MSKKPSKSSSSASTSNKKKKNNKTITQSAVPSTQSPIKKAKKKKKSHSSTHSTPEPSSLQQTPPPLNPQDTFQGSTPKSKKKNRRKTAQSQNSTIPHSSSATQTPQPSIPDQPLLPLKKKKSKKKNPSFPSPSPTHPSSNQQTPQSPSIQEVSQTTALPHKKTAKEKKVQSRGPPCTESSCTPPTQNPSTSHEISQDIAPLTKKTRRLRGKKKKLGTIPSFQDSPGLLSSTQQSPQTMSPSCNRKRNERNVQSHQPSVIQSSTQNETPHPSPSTLSAPNRLPLKAQRTSSMQQVSPCSKKMTPKKRATPEATSRTEHPGTLENTRKKRGKKGDKSSQIASVKNQCKESVQNNSTAQSLQVLKSGASNCPQASKVAFSNEDCHEAQRQTHLEKDMQFPNGPRMPAPAPSSSARRPSGSSHSQSVHVLGPLSQRSQPQFTSNLEERHPYCLRTVRRVPNINARLAHPVQGRQTGKPNDTTQRWNNELSRSQSHEREDVVMIDVGDSSAVTQPHSTTAKRKRVSPEPRNGCLPPQSLSPSNGVECNQDGQPGQNSFIASRTRSQLNCADRQVCHDRARSEQTAKRQRYNHDGQSVQIGFVTSQIQPQRHSANYQASREHAHPKQLSYQALPAQDFRTWENGSFREGRALERTEDPFGKDRSRNHAMPAQGSQTCDIGRSREERASNVIQNPSRNSRSRNQVSLPVEDRHAAPMVEDRRVSQTIEDRQVSQTIEDRQVSQKIKDRPSVSKKRDRRMQLQKKVFSLTGEYYGIRCGRGGFSGVTTCWNSCSQHVMGYRDAVYAMFDSWEKAEEFADRYGTGASINYRSNLRHFFRKKKKGSKVEPGVAQLPWELENEPKVVSLVTGVGWLRFGIGSGIGGFGVFLSEHNPYNHAGLLEGNVTEFRLQLKAALEALEIVHQHRLVKDGGIIEVYTASEDVKNGIDHWLGRWDRTGQWTRYGESVGSQDLWKAILSVRKELDKSGTRIQMIWVRRSASIPAVQKANALARLGFSHMVEEHASLPATS